MIDGQGRSILFLALVTLSTNLYSKTFLKLIKRKPIIIWIVWCVFGIVNLFIVGYNIKTPFILHIFFNFLLPLLVMAIVSLEYIRNKIGLLKLLRFSFAIYLVLVLIVIYTSSSGIERVGGALGNQAPLNVIFLAFVVFVLESHKRFNYKYIPFILTAVLFVVLSYATRKALIALIIMGIFYYISKLRFSVWKILQAIVISVFSYLLFIFILDKTVIGERLLNTQEEGIKNNDSGIEMLSFLGDRAFFYIEGYKIFKENPITGIGFGNFSSHLSFGQRIHSEYIVQLCEGGLIGSTLFIMFNYWLLKNLILRMNDKNAFVFLGGLMSILFINFSAWTYSFNQYFVCYGVVIGYCLTTNPRRNKKLIK
ncbi:MAG: hypothetical protein BM564_12990 [Bacteroidetes bacterium MedPE-SWsnd-G2]|nr:MAG: hypothetical protein BM564_12990 [Bacteroidetes bacterium MedPE-SWsnd-G2]